MEPWIRRVETYMDELQQLADHVDAIFLETRVASTNADSNSVQDSSTQLTERLDDLENKVAQRDELLKADDAPTNGLTLFDKLSETNEVDLADRADRLAAQIALTHERSMSLFVCQFHLSNLTTDLVRILTGADQPPTYGGPGTTPVSPQGGLFNEAG